MAVRRSRAVLTAAVAVGAVAAGVALARAVRRPIVTLYADPGFAGPRRALSTTGLYDVAGLGLRRIGSVRVHEAPFDFHRAHTAFEVLRLTVDRDPEERRAARAFLPTALTRMLNPFSWITVHDPTGDRRGWVALGPDPDTDDQVPLVIEEDFPDVVEWGMPAWLRVGVRG